MIHIIQYVTWLMKTTREVIRRYQRVTYQRVTWLYACCSALQCVAERDAHCRTCAFVAVCCSVLQRDSYISTCDISTCDMTIMSMCDTIHMIQRVTWLVMSLRKMKTQWKTHCMTWLVMSLRGVIHDAGREHAARPLCDARQSACPTTCVSLCNTLRHNATHCDTLRHTATHCDTLRHTATHCNTLQHTATKAHVLQCASLSATHCNALQHAVAHCNTLQQKRMSYNLRLAL